MIAIVAESARVADGHTGRVPEDIVAQGETAAEKFLLRWRGEADPKHVKAIDTYWICTAEHGLNASTFTARIVASTGADTGAAMSAAVGALSGPLHGGAPARVLPMLDEVARTSDPEGYVNGLLSGTSGSWGSATASTAPRTRGRGCCGARRRSSARPRFEVAEELERVALKALASTGPTVRSPPTSSTGRRSCWTSPRSRSDLTPAMFACARVAGWSAPHPRRERTGRLIRPAAQYVGPAARPASALTERQVRLEPRGGGVEANLLAESGNERDLAKLRASLGRGARGCARRARRSHRARRRLPGRRPVPLPPEGGAPAARARGRQPRVPGLGPALAGAALARPPGGATPFGRSCTRSRTQTSNAAVRRAGDHVAPERLAAARHDRAAPGSPRRKGSTANLQRTAAKVAAGLEKKAKAR